MLEDIYVPRLYDVSGSMPTVFYHYLFSHGLITQNSLPYAGNDNTAKRNPSLQPSIIVFLTLGPCLHLKL